MVSATPPDGAEDIRRGPEGPRYVYPEPLTAEDLEDMDRVLDVDGEAYLRWLMGEGPDPCRESSG